MISHYDFDDFIPPLEMPARRQRRRTRAPDARAPTHRRAKCRHCAGTTTPSARLSCNPRAPATYVASTCHTPSTGSSARAPKASALRRKIVPSAWSPLKMRMPSCGATPVMAPSCAPAAPRRAQGMRSATLAHAQTPHAREHTRRRARATDTCTPGPPTHPPHRSTPPRRAGVAHLRRAVAHAALPLGLLVQVAGLGQQLLPRLPHHDRETRNRLERVRRGELGGAIVVARALTLRVRRGGSCGGKRWGWSAGTG
jgi:hypothetical protein